MSQKKLKGILSKLRYYVLHLTKGSYANNRILKIRWTLKTLIQKFLHLNVA